MHSKYINWGLRVVGIATVGGSSIAWAQEATQVLEEVLVTATRRAEDVQSVPISIAAVTGDELELRNLTSVQNLNGAIPNLNVVSTIGGPSGATSFAVRGIPRVGFYIDGIWQASTGALMDFNFVDVDRVEVLRGPQGTLYGRDSTGGAIRLFTNRPNDEFQVKLNGTVGSFDRRDVDIAVDVPFGENFHTRWTLAQLNRDGYVYSKTQDDWVGSIDQSFGLADLAWEPTDRFSARLKYQQVNSEPSDPRITTGYNAATAQYSGLQAGVTELYTLAGATFNGVTQVAGWPGGQLGDWESRVGDPDNSNFDEEQVSLDLSYELTDKMTLQSWTGYTDQSSKRFFDFDNSQYRILTDLYHTASTLSSEEIQLTGSNGRFDWVTGLYYWDQSNSNRQTRWGMQEFSNGTLSSATVLAQPQCTAPTPPGFFSCAAAIGFYTAITNTDAITTSDENGYAVFGEVETHLTDRLDLTVGYRQHTQDIETTPIAVTPGISATRPSTVGPLVGGGDPFAGTPIRTDKVSFDKGTSRVALKRTFTDQIMGYISYSEGFNAGGVSAINFVSGRVLIPYDPETIKSYEVGFRSDLLESRLRFNASLFHIDWEDIQISSDIVDPDTGQIALSFVTRNAASAAADGAEVELTWLATDALQLNTSVGVLDTGYTDVTTRSVTLDTDFAQAPDLTYTIGLQHSAALRNGASLVTRFDYNYTGSFQRFALASYQPNAFGLGDIADAGDYGLVNARLAYSPPDRKWEAALFGSNLTDERYLNGGIYHGLWQADWSTVGRPREVGVSLKVSLQ